MASKSPSSDPSTLPIIPLEPPGAPGAPALPAAAAPPGPSTTGRDEPPPYEARPETVAPDPDEVLPPTTFVIHGRFIYPIQLSASSSTNAEPDSVPAYQLSRAIHVREQAAEALDLSRMDPRVRTTADGWPSVGLRPKDIYSLHHRRELAYSGIPFAAWLEPRSRKGLGKVQIEKSPLFRPGYRAVPVVSDVERRARERVGRPVPKKGEYFFCIRERGGGSKDWQWYDPKGSLVANQIREAAPGSEPAAGAEGDGGEKAGEEVHKLEVLVPLPRRERDGLVALWCLWMLHIQIQECRPRKTWEDRKRILQAPGGYFGVRGGIF